MEVRYPERALQGNDIYMMLEKDGPEPARDHNPGDRALLWDKLVMCWVMEIAWQEQRP